MSKPTPDISVQAFKGDRPNEFEFILLVNGAAVPQEPDYTIVSVSWDLGDGTIVNGLFFEIEHQYKQAGDYSVSVQVVFQGKGKHESDKVASTKKDKKHKRENSLLKAAGVKVRSD